MDKKKVILLFMSFILIFGSACFATEFASEFVEEQADQLTEKVEGTLVEFADTGLEDLKETQAAFGDLEIEAVQETVSASLGMDIDEIREKYIIPEDAIYITQLGDMVNFQMMRPMEDVMDYYQISFAREGLKVLDDKTIITDMTASFVYTGHSSGKLMVIQLVALNQGQTNVSIQYKDE
ncbi:MAG: hypothetical protein JEZ00_10200 [Anaerolineaceae bacterium]|nr:hypothetical protein [Anaerolineaceae bacterium]